MTEVAIRNEALSTLPAEQDWKTILSMAGTLVKSGLLPSSVKTPEAAAAIILKGAEIGIPPMQAFSHIHVIQGKPTCSAELMLAILARGGITWEWVKDGSDGDAIISFRRPGFPKPVWGRFSETDAKAASLTGKDSWKHYRANMLRARAISNGARMIAPDLLAGMSYTPEELGAEVDAEGQPIEAEAVISTVEPPKDTEYDQCPPEEVMPGPDPEEEEPPENGKKEDPPWVRFRRRCGELKEVVGEEAYYKVLAQFEIAKCSEIPKDDTVRMSALVRTLEAEAQAQAAGL